VTPSPPGADNFIFVSFSVFCQPRESRHIGENGSVIGRRENTVLYTGKWGAAL